MRPFAIPPSGAEALEAARGLPPEARHVGQVSRAFGPEAARWAFAQWDLRQRAQAKFARAEAMLFDREGLEMASHERVAEAHARLFPAGELVADLTCGIGSDLIALARRGPAVGFELSPERAALARHNLAAHESSAEVREENALAARWDFEHAFADPSRRAGGQRLADPGSFEPPLHALECRMAGLRTGIVKLSPMLRDQDLGVGRRRVEFWSFGGECREAVVWLGREGSEAQPAAAAHIETGLRLSASEEQWLATDEPDEALFEADPAAIRAHALGSLGRLLNARPLGDSNGYLTGPSEAAGDEARAFSRAYRVLGAGRADEARIRSDLRRLDARLEAVKVRGAKEDPIRWQKRLRPEGGRAAVLILFPVGRSLRFALAEPI
jgi:SAM-dependent methyltransferase